MIECPLTTEFLRYARRKPGTRRPLSLPQNRVVTMEICFNAKFWVSYSTQKFRIQKLELFRLESKLIMLNPARRLLLLVEDTAAFSVPQVFEPWPLAYTDSF